MPDLCFADSETRSPIDLPTVGAYKYATHRLTDALVWTWAFDDEPVSVWSPEWAWLNRTGLPDPEPTALLDHIENGGYFIAWNAFFDRWIWNGVMVPKYGWPELRLEQVLCAQSQAEANNLPGSLDKAAETLRVPHRKDPQGKRLINILSKGKRSDWPKENMSADRMGRFRAYGLGDTATMRDVFQCTRPLTADEWHDYHVSERINDRGVMVDVEFAEAAKQYAAEEFEDINEELAEVTGVPRMTVTNHGLKARWLYDNLWPDEEVQHLAWKPPKEKDGPDRYTCDRPTREAVLELLSQPEHADLFEDDLLEDVIDFLELIEAGNSAAVRKFTAIVNMEVEGRVHGQYSFNGAGQTGRYSSRGIQIHNLIRAALVKGQPERALDAMEMIINQAAPEELEDEFGLPISRLLARLIRPTFIAPEGKVFVWADYDQIEGRKLPWLANSRGAEEKLNLYRRNIDTYKVAALPIYNLTDLEQVTEDQRQVGKVAELALGFGGSKGAFRAMGRGYGVSVSEAVALEIVYTWRNNNGWAQEFWDELWQASIYAFNNPNTWVPAGRVQYAFIPNIMHGTLVCRLPSGRWLVYPQFRHFRKEVEEDGRKFTRWQTDFIRGFGSGAGRIDLWYGTEAENVTQASANDIQRWAMRQLDKEDLADVVLHTHDEIVAECREEDEDEVRELIVECMTEDLPEWADGCPITAGVESGYFYTK